MDAPAFEYHLFGAHIRFGPGCALQLSAELRALGCSRPVVLMQKRTASSAGWELLRASLQDMSIQVIDTVPKHSSVALVQDIARRLRDDPCDCVVAIGGGSVSDSAKALAMVLAEGGELSDHATRFFPPAEVQIPVRTKPKLPVISLPVTAAGAEITPSFGIRDTDHKLLFWNRDLASKTVLIDPVLSESLPLPLMQQTSMNGIAHCLEGMYSRHRSPVADGLAIQALTVFAHALNDDMDEHEQRWRLLLGGHLSGMVLSMARTCLHHAICHVIGARHSVGHGAANTVILAHALRFNEGQVQHLLAPALAALNQASAMTCTRVSEWISECVSRLGLPSTLSDLGLASHDLPAIAEQTMTERGLALNPRKVTHPDEILLLLQEAL